MLDHNQPDLAAMLVNMIEPTTPEYLSGIKSLAKTSASTDLILNNHNLCRIYPDLTLVSYKRNGSLKDSLVRATIPHRD